VSRTAPDHRAPEARIRAALATIVTLWRVTLDPPRARETSTRVVYGPRLPGSSEAWYEKARETAREHVDAARELADRPVDTRIEVGSPARVIVDVAEEGPFDHVVIGSHGREGVSRILLGSVAEGVARRSPVPVTVAR